MKKLEEIQAETEIMMNIWIIASFDDDNRNCFTGIAYRLHNTSEAKVTALICKHKELFRIGFKNQTLLDDYKTYVQTTKPEWIVDGNGVVEQEKLNNISQKNVFRSQFRVHDKKPSNNEIVTLGINHIKEVERLEIQTIDRKRESISKIIIPIISLVVALSAILGTTFNTYLNTQSQKELYEYSTNSKLRHDNYVQFMNLLYLSFNSVKNPNKMALENNLMNLDNSVYSIEAILKDTAESENFRHKTIEFQNFCMELNSNGKLNDSIVLVQTDKFIIYRNYFRNFLFKRLLVKQL